VSEQRITKEDIEQQLRALQGEVTERVMSQKQKIIAGAAATTFIVLLVVYLLGRKAGKKKTTVVEIRRF
jgi:hypothetical protein